jgi:hypothetical protein
VRSGRARGVGGVEGGDGKAAARGEPTVGVGHVVSVRWSHLRATQFSLFTLILMSFCSIYLQLVDSARMDLISIPLYVNYLSE